MDRSIHFEVTGSEVKVTNDISEKSKMHFNVNIVNSMGLQFEDLRYHSRLVSILGGCGRGYSHGYSGSDGCTAVCGSMHTGTVRQDAGW